LAPELTPAILALQAERFAEAEVHLKRYVHGNGVDGDAEFIQGLIYHRQRLYGPAKPHLLKAIELRPDYPVINHFLGYCLYNLGELPEARAAFEKHLSFDPNEGDSHFGIGLIDLEEGRLDEARARFLTSIELHQRAIAGAPQKATRLREIAKAHARIADVYMLQDRWIEARDQLLLATKQWPDHYEAWHKLATVQERLGDKQAAEQARQMHETVRDRIRPSAPVQPRAPADASPSVPSAPPVLSPPPQSPQSERVP
jgi:tetratricopeptide (TPR) repeat protein